MLHIVSKEKSDLRFIHDVLLIFKHELPKIDFLEYKKKINYAK